MSRQALFPGPSGLVGSTLKTQLFSILLRYVLTLHVAAYTFAVRYIALALCYSIKSLHQERNDNRVGGSDVGSGGEVGEKVPRC